MTAENTVSQIGLAGKKVLVTGASGFIGSHLCTRLIAAGSQVYGISRTARRTHESIHWIEADVANIDAVRGAFQVAKPDLIFHLASYVMGAHHLENVLPTFHANLASSVNLLTAAAEFGCERIVLTGSLAEPDFDKGELFPVAPYAAAKWASSGYARMFHALYGVPIVLARVFMVYGPGQWDGTKLVPYVISSLLEGKAPKITSGTRLIDWIYVSDVVEGFLALANASGIEGSTLEIGSGDLISIRDLVEAIHRISGSSVAPEFGAVPGRPLEPLRIADTTTIRDKTGWSPRVRIEDGLHRTIEWYREHTHGKARELSSRA